MNRTVAIIGVVLLLLFLARAFKPDSRQTIDLTLTAGGAPAGEVELLFFKPSDSSPSECAGPGLEVIGAGAHVQSREDGTYRLRRRISPTKIGSRYTARAAKKRTWTMAMCAKVDGQWVRLWEGTPMGARRSLRLDCELSTRSCQAQYARQLDETLKPIIEVMAGGLLLLLGLILVIAGRGHNGVGTIWLVTNCLLFAFAQAYAAWLHRFPGPSKAAMVILLIWGALTAIWLVSYPIVRWRAASRETA